VTSAPETKGVEADDGDVAVFGGRCPWDGMRCESVRCLNGCWLDRRLEAHVRDPLEVARA